MYFVHLSISNMAERIGLDNPLGVMGHKTYVFRSVSVFLRITSRRFFDIWKPNITQTIA